MIAILNHIYKVVWNRTRACWQVVSELAKHNGRMKSLWRRSRREREPQSGIVAYRQLAAALAITLGCLLGGMPGIAYAAGEATASGVLSYGELSYDGSNVFKNWQDGSIKQVGTTFNTAVLSTYGPRLTNPTTGAAMAISAASFNTILNYYNSSAGGSHTYDTVMAVIYVPDPANPGSTAAKTYTVYTVSGGLLMDYDHLTNDYNISNILNDYWKLPEIAQQLYQAQQDAQSSEPVTKAAGEAKLAELISNGLPHFYAAQGDDWQSGTLLTLGTTSRPMKLTSFPVVLPASPTDASYSYSYTNQTVSADGVWRPLDRLESTSASVGNYSISSQYILNADGTVTIYNPATTISVNNGDGSGTAVTDPTVITVKDLTVGRNGTVDLSYLNTHYDVNGNFNPADPIVSHDIILTASTSGYTGLYPTDFNGTQYQRSINRYLLVNNANLADGTTFRLGVYGLTKSAATNNTTAIDTASASDSVYITNAAAVDGHANLYVELGWVPGLGTASQGSAIGGGNVLGILNGADQFTVTGRTSLADGIFSQYEITPVIGKTDNYFTDPNDSSLKTGTVWYLDSYSYFDLGTASESGRSAADNRVALNNLWRSNYLNLFRRAGSLHRQNFTEQRVALLGDSAPTATNSATPAETGSRDNTADTARTMGIAAYPVPAEDQKENAWAEVWHGKYQSSSGYGRQVDQSYNGLQVGYDKLLNHEIHGGKVYTGFFLSKIEGDSTTAGGGGDQDSQGLGMYASWVGNKGHYLDAALMASRLTNDYHLTGNTGDGTVGQVTGDYNTWAYGLGLQYGYQSPANNSGWYWEPSAALFVGRTDGVSYSLSNDLGISQDSADTVTGRLGLKVGRQLAHGQGNVYAGVAALHEFAGGTGMNALFGSQRMALDTAGGKDTWWEWSLGGNWKISPTGVFNLDLNKTTGGSDGNTWRVNGGLNWTWGGFWGGSGAAAKEIALPGSTQADEPARGSAALIVGPAPTLPAAAGEQLSAGNPSGRTETVQTPAASQPETAGETPASKPASPQPAAEQPASAAYSGGSAEYTFAPLTVEAARPAWETQLSPGQVSVVYPEQFEGEQKDLPALLERVPGLFVQRVSGDGHYTVARVRGATGAQVNVYVDGVLMNLNGDAAVNLSTIPVDNVERIEVYRGYVPARFSGSPLGGVINIVTKKPKEAGGTITQGVKSYGGYTGTYQFTAPAGSGSLLATFQRDIWGGDFSFNNIPDNYSGKSFGDFRRRSNGYQNEDGMVKWQDDHWTIKAAWKQLHEELPRAVSRLGVPGAEAYNYGDYLKGYYDAAQTIDQKEFQIGRRDTAGNLDWGWRLYYLDSQKDYRHVGLYRQGYTERDFASYPGQLWSAFHSKKWGANLNTAWKLGGSHLLEINFDYSHESMDADGSNWDTFDDSMTHLNRQFIREYKIQEYHLTLQDSITLNQAGDFKLTPVLRADRVVMDTMADNDQTWKYSGAAALQKQLSEHWGVKTSWGTYNRHPNFYELFGDGATIRPNKAAAAFFDLAGDGTWETGHQFDFSINWQGKMARADTATALTWFQRRAKNQFALWQPSVPNAPASYFPMDDARVHGLELTHNMNWDRLTLSLAGTWQKSEYSGNNMGGNYNGMKSNISYTPEWVWNARLDYRFPGDKLSVFTEYTYTGKQFLGADDSKGAYMEALSTVDLGLKYAFDKNWKLSAGVNDLFNKGYELRQFIGSNESTLAYPLAGRTYYATMEYKF